MTTDSTPTDTETETPTETTGGAADGAGSAGDGDGAGADTEALTEWSDITPHAWWANLLKRSDATSESETEFDGLLSYSTEYHAAVMGFAAGFGAVAPLPTEMKLALAGALGMDSLGPRKLFGDDTNKHVAAEVRAEPWYAVGGLFIGYALGTLWAGGLAGLL